MWRSLSRDGEAIRHPDSEPQPNPWHQEDPHPDAAEGGEGDGTWGERDAGEICEKDARHEYEALRSDLIQLHKTRTRDTQVSRATVGRTKSHTAASRRRLSSAHGGEAKGDNDGRVDEQVEEGKAGEGEREDDSDDEFELGDFMREGHFEKRTEEGSAKKVGVVYENLTVKGTGSTATFVRTVPDAILGTFGPDLYHLLCRALPFFRLRKPQTRTLIHDLAGCVRDGEMMLVLGRPGSGCSTFLKAVSNNRDSFAAVEGEVSYGGIPADRQKRLYRGEVTYNGEDDVHFANLSVWKTLTFALMNKTPRRHAREEIPLIAGALLRMFGIRHTRNTVVSLFGATVYPLYGSSKAHFFVDKGF